MIMALHLLKRVIQRSTIFFVLILLSVTTTVNAQEVAPVAALVDGLAQRLESNPDDVKGWVLLAKSYAHLGQYESAHAAAARARALGYSGGDLDFSGQLVGKPALNKSGASAFLMGGRKPGIIDLEAINRAIDPQLRVSIVLDDTIRDRLPPDTVVFVYARQSGTRGPPSAARRLTLADLPPVVTLSDSDWTGAGAKLSQTRALDVGVRLSSDGSPMGSDKDPGAVAQGIVTGRAMNVELHVTQPEGLDSPE